jgi:hypothetical protein|tara:strand:- start:339 stop:1187 length:849 start_codon:yes stop_codon:yes gene_type:complete
MEEILKILYEFLFSSPDPNMQMGIPLFAIGAAASLVGGLFKSGAARRRQRAAARDRRKANAAIVSLENSRQAVINPYDNFTNLSSLAKDLTGKLSNPYNNLGVATKSSEIQMEQSDIALANTLDTLRATGASAGGATALAQAALQSKQGVAANIEQQEAANEKLRAQGEQYLQQAEIAEQRRLQGVQISEGQRIQGAEAQGKMFKFQAQEARDNSKLSYLRGQTQQAKQREFAAQQAKANAIGGVFGQIGGTLMGAGLGSQTQNTYDKSGNVTGSKTSKYFV